MKKSCQCFAPQLFLLETPSLSMHQLKVRIFFFLIKFNPALTDYYAMLKNIQKQCNAIDTKSSQILNLQCIAIFSPKTDLFIESI